jgi:hypothetical protein
MLDKEPFQFPARQRFTYDPGVPNRQLWAIGMVVVQWSMTEWIIDSHIRRLMGDDAAIIEEYERVRSFQQTLVFWEKMIEHHGTDPLKSDRNNLIQFVKDLASQRDEVIHRMWGGGMEGDSWSAGGMETNDAALMHNPGEKIKSKSGRVPFTWKASFHRLRKLATDISELNRDLLVATIFPPQGDVDQGNQVSA